MTSPNRERAEREVQELFQGWPEHFKLIDAVTEKLIAAYDKDNKNYTPLGLETKLKEWFPCSCMMGNAGKDHEHDPFCAVIFGPQVRGLINQLWTSTVERDQAVKAAREEADRLAARAARYEVGAARIGSWLSAALDDPNVCEEMKADIHAWMEAVHGRKATHRCKICGAEWMQYDDEDYGRAAAKFWTLMSPTCGQCCDNVAMGDQIEVLLDAPQPPADPRVEAARQQGRDEGLEMAARICETKAREFLDPQYANPQPVGSILERFACAECAKAILALIGQPAQEGGK